MTTYTVLWTIEIDAETPQEAAAQAFAIQRDPASMAVVFDVWTKEQHGTTTVMMYRGRVDMMDAVVFGEDVPVVEDPS